jgi:hypothetical protein
MTSDSCLKKVPVHGIQIDSLVMKEVDYEYLNYSRNIDKIKNGAEKSSDTNPLRIDFFFLA